MTLNCEGVGNGWMKVVKLEMNNTSHTCPAGTTLGTDLPKRVCKSGKSEAGCSSTSFTVHGIQYSRVCGKIIAYQYASPDSFKDIYRTGTGINDNYVDGISLTHGKPRSHIWTFAASPGETSDVIAYSCSCTNTHLTGSASQPPSFVGTDYFCDTGSTEQWKVKLYIDDPLWDGYGCGLLNTCCSLNNPPWFLKQMQSSTNDDIEMRMCHDEPTSDEDTPIEVIELYVQ